jgi:hypothetical protein
VTEAYRPWGAAAEVFRCWEDEVLLSGPGGTGKSRAYLEKLHLCALKYPGMRGLIVRKTRVSLTDPAQVRVRLASVDAFAPACILVFDSSTRAWRLAREAERTWGWGAGCGNGGRDAVRRRSGSRGGGRGMVPRG